MPANSKRKRKGNAGSAIVPLQSLISFVLGCIISAAIVLNIRVSSLHHSDNNSLPAAVSPLEKPQIPPMRKQQSMVSKPNTPEISNVVESQEGGGGTPRSILDGVRILVGIAAFDFSQIPHLEEVLDGYFDMCASGAKVDVVIHSTVAYPVTLIDLLNSRFMSTNPSPHSGFSIKIILVHPQVRLHLVDFHRPYFYERINDYDLFIYTEDDIRVSPRTVAAYLTETERVKELVGPQEASNFNVGVVRYEYNFPPDVIINDKTRHATQNVTRVYWEHAWKPAIPKSVDAVPQKPLSDSHVHMSNHHQGMFLATRELLLAWKDRTGCEFHLVKNRPGLKNNPGQPAEGTQRVWMSSQQLYGNRHCGVQQVIPMDNFGQFNILHLPNKNYRRVGRKGRLGGNTGKNNPDNEFPDGTEKIEGPSNLLLSAMELHILMRQKWPATPQQSYKGIEMVDNVSRGKTPLTIRRMQEYHEYVARGGVMSEDDMKKTALVEDA